MEKFACVGNEDRTKKNDFQRKLKLKNHHKCNISFSVEVQTERSKFTHFDIVSTSTDSSLQKLKNRTMTSLKGNTVAEAFIDKDFTLPF